MFFFLLHSSSFLVDKKVLPHAFLSFILPNPGIVVHKSVEDNLKRASNKLLFLLTLTKIRNSDFDEKRDHSSWCYQFSLTLHKVIDTIS